MSKHKKTKPSGEINRWRFIIWWMVASVIVWPLSAILLIPMTFISSSILVLIVPGSAVMSSPGYLFNSLINACIFAMAPGLAIGILQLWVIRSHLGINPLRWIRLSAMGTILGAILVWLTTYISIVNITDNFLQMIAAPFLIGISVMQWRELRNHVRSAWLWVAANAVAALAFGAYLYFNIEGNPSNSGKELEIILVSILLMGWVTGATMLWLVQNGRAIPAQKSKEWDAV